MGKDGKGWKGGEERKGEKGIRVGGGSCLLVMDAPGGMHRLLFIDSANAVLGVAKKELNYLTSFAAFILEELSVQIDILKTNSYRGIMNAFSN